MTRLKHTGNIKLLSDHKNRPYIYDVTYRQNNQPKPVIIFCHGFKGFKDWGYFNKMAGYFAEKGFIFIKLNFSHNGTTPKYPTEFVDLKAFGFDNWDIQLDDLGQLIDSVKKEGIKVPSGEIDTEQIFLMGHSRGGSLAILKAAEDSRIKALITIAAVADMEARFSEEVVSEWKEKDVMYIDNSRTNQKMPVHYQFYSSLVNNRERLFVPDAAKKLNIPWLIIHGSDDETVKIKDAELLHEWNNNSELYIAEGGNHTLGGKHPWEEKKLPPEAESAFFKAQEFFHSQGIKKNT